MPVCSRCERRKTCIELGAASPTSRARPWSRRRTTAATNRRGPDALEKAGMQTRVLTALEISSVAEPYIRRRAVRHLEKGRVVVFACGTGNPYFSTDTAAARRGAEIGAELILMAKSGGDGVYSADPKIDPSATRYDTLSYDEAIQKNLQVMDQTALALCRENNLPVIVFDTAVPGNILRVATGERVGTRVGME